MPQVNPKRTVVAINGDAGNFVTIRLTTWAKYVEVDEDPSVNGAVKQGLQYNPLDPFVQSSQIQNVPAAFLETPVTPAGTPELTFGDRYHVNDGHTAPLGNPGSGGDPVGPGAGPALGTPLVQLRSNSATATQVIVTEYA
jgi:hypothetical protein